MLVNAIFTSYASKYETHGMLSTLSAVMSPVSEHTRFTSSRAAACTSVFTAKQYTAHVNTAIKHTGGSKATIKFGT